MRIAILLLICAVTTIHAQGLASRVREVVLDQRQPVIVYASIHGITTLQFPDMIQAIDGNGFTQKTDEEGDFRIYPGANWVSVRSLKAGAVQNLSVVISGKVYAVVIETTEQNDFSVLFRFPRATRQLNGSVAWSPLRTRP